MLVASIRETHSKWRRTRNGCVATRGAQKNSAVRNTSHSECLAIRTGFQFGMAPKSEWLDSEFDSKFGKHLLEMAV